MAFTTTTLTAAVAVNDVIINVTSAAGFVANEYCKIEQEIFQVGKGYVSGLAIPVSRGQNGSVTAAHAITANVTVGLGSDFSAPTAPTVVSYPPNRARVVRSVGTNVAIAGPVPGSDLVVLINGTVALTTLTIASPTKDQDGDMLYLISNGKAAHVVTYTTTGLGNAGAGYTALTMIVGSQQCIPLMAANGIWVHAGGLLSGTLTNILTALARQQRGRAVLASPLFQGVIHGVIARNALGIEMAKWEQPNYRPNGIRSSDALQGFVRPDGRMPVCPRPCPRWLGGCEGLRTRSRAETDRQCCRIVKSEAEMAVPGGVGESPQAAGSLDSDQRELGAIA
jgi:hypothetical protein